MDCCTLYRNSQARTPSSGPACEARRKSHPLLLATEPAAVKSPASSQVMAAAMLHVGALPPVETGLAASTLRRGYGYSTTIIWAIPEGYYPTEAISEMLWAMRLFVLPTQPGPR
jgi:hypothetical protein